jgi:hypothetical protein
MNHLHLTCRSLNEDRSDAETDGSQDNQARPEPPKQGKGERKPRRTVDSAYRSALNTELGQGKEKGSDPVRARQRNLGRHAQGGRP